MASVRTATRRASQRGRVVETFYDYVLASERWARLRDRIIRLRGRRCESCGAAQIDCDLDLHHLTYERLGFERDDDVQVLCRPCHGRADRQRQAAAAAVAEERRYRARLDGWATKRYGDDWQSYDYEAIVEQFDAWLEDLEDE